jgi:hypothetical protein
MAVGKKKAERAIDDKKKLYWPVYRVMTKVIKRLEELDLDIPIYKLAWMEVRGEFIEKRHQDFRKDLMDFLRVSNEYRRIYWNLIKLARRKFEVEMMKDGSFAPDNREYESLKNEIPQVILKGNKDLWISTYNDYLPRIRERSLKKKRKPRDGAKIFRAIEKDLKEVRETLMNQQKESLEYAMELKDGLSQMKNSPGKPWGFWKDDLEKAPETLEMVDEDDKKYEEVKRPVSDDRKKQKRKSGSRKTTDKEPGKGSGKRTGKKTNKGKK